MNNRQFKVGFIGTGNIAGVHADSVKKIPETTLISAFDPNPIALDRFAARHSIKKNTDLDGLLNDPTIDTVHILTPPDSHADLTTRCLASGKSIFVEKPLCTTSDDIALLGGLKVLPHQVIAVNQNMVFDPSMQELQRLIDSRKFGKVRHLDLVFRPTLRQLSGMQFSHWMFRSRLNLLLEQAVHPVSQLLALFGMPNEIRAIATENLNVNSECNIVTSFVAAIQFGTVSASFHFGVGALYPVWRLTAYCDDGVIDADMVANVCVTQGRTPYIAQIDHAISAAKSSKERVMHATSNLIKYSKATVGVGERCDSFYLGIKNSIEHFYGAVAQRHSLITNMIFGLNVVEVCHELNGQLSDPVPKTLPALKKSPIVCIENTNKGLVCLLGASGFIGRQTTLQLVNQGYKVRAVSRSVQNLPDLFQHQLVETMRGDVRCQIDMENAICGADWVINLAHGGGGGDYDEIKDALVNSAILVAKVAISVGVKRVVHIGSIASVYLGDPAERINGATPSDSRPEVRGDYARAKALADQEFAKICRDGNIEYVILRPGVVVGKETHPLHSALGFFNNEGHVVGWSAGDHPLPFVMVDDVASAIILCMITPNAAGKTYNIAGDVRLSAKEYVDELSKSSQRQIQYHPKAPRRLWFEDVVKCLIKRIGGRKAPFPNIRDFRSRAMYATVDCSDLKRDTGWTPVSDKTVFLKSIFS